MFIKSCFRAISLAVLLSTTLSPSTIASPPATTFSSLADLVEPLLPAVANISTTTLIRGHSDMGQTPLDSPFPKGSPLEDFFKEFLERMQPEGPRNATALGSGFIIDPEG